MKNTIQNTSNLSDITILIPVYNESKSIKIVIDKIKQTLSAADFTWEIIVVEDGSTDNTAEILKTLNVKTIYHEINRGYGAALKTGLKNIQSPWFLIIDADGTYPENEILTLASYRENYDMVIASRTGENVHIPLLRRPPKAFIRKFASYVANYPIPDLNSGLRLMKTDVVKKFVHLLPDGFSFTSTISLAMLVDGYRVKYIPINYLHRKGKSKIRPFYDTINFLTLITRTATYFRPLRVFVPLSIFLFIAGLTVLFGSWYYLDRIMDSTSTILIMTGVQIFALGLLAELIVRRTKT